MRRSNVADVELYAAAWERAARDHRASGRYDLADIAERCACQLKLVRDQATAPIPDYALSQLEEGQ